MTVARRLLRNSLILLVIGVVATLHGLIVGSPETPPGEMAPQLMLGIWFIFIGVVMALISWLVIRNKKKKGEM
jgi:LPXTG-motif cell wall-anchored protein